MEFKLPELGEGVNEGELVSWKVKEGDQVTDDQPLCDVMTDKATIEIPSPFHGTVKKLHVKEGETVTVGDLMISFEGESKSTSNGSSEKKETKEAKKEEKTPEKKAPVERKAPAPTPSQPMVAASEPGKVMASPQTRKMAREMGVDLSRVSGSGPAGRILREDLLQASRSFGSLGGMPRLAPARSDRASTGGEKRVPFKGLRRKIAEKMRESKDTAAHFTYVEEADATALVELRKEAKKIGAEQGIKVTFLPFVMKAMVAALKKYPDLNSSLDAEKNEWVYKHYYNIGLSIQTDEGLTAPVIKDVEHKSIWELARDIQDVVDRARQKKLTLEDFKDGTITLTNAGSIGGLFATPIINYPEVAIMGFNKIFRKPVVKEINGREEIVIRDWTYFSLSLDHRIVDGAIGAEFMNLFVRYIENPSLMLLDENQ